MKYLKTSRVLTVIFLDLDLKVMNKFSTFAEDRKLNQEYFQVLPSVFWDLVLDGLFCFVFFQMWMCY